MTTNSNTILVCDDEPFILESVSYVVKKEGFNLLTAENGKDALKVARSLMPELILLDVNMPEMTGYEVCQHLKDDEATQHICIIMLTANVQLDDIETAKQVGADGFITKPFSPRDLKAKLHELFD